MQNTAKTFVPRVNPSPTRRCLACGNPLPPRLRRYCAMSCPQYLLASLNRRTGLLQTLSIRYGTFYFSDHAIVMDLLPYDSDQIYSYMLPRSTGKKPVDDFCDLSNILGRLWWAEKNRTKKRYLASREVLNRGRKSGAPVHSVMPASLTIPSVRTRNLVTLELQSDDLSPGSLEQNIRNAYRRQAKRHHPDLGGCSETFIKIQDAYEKLRLWAKHPTFIRRRGFADKWLYEGAYNRWVKPIVPRRSKP